MAADAPRCGVCSASRGGSVTRNMSDADRVTDEILATVMPRPLLAREETLASLMLDAAAIAPLALSELGGGLGRIEDQAPSLDELESLLTVSTPATSIGGIALGRLFDRDGRDAETLRRGLTFLRKRRFDLAREWWALQRVEVEGSKPKLELLFLLMELYTVTLADDARSMRAITERLRHHPLFHDLRRSP